MATRQRWKGILAIWTAGGSVLVLVLVSPLLLSAMGSDIDWQLVSNIGQSYGFASAVLSAAALLAVAWSIRFQQVQNRLGRVQSIRMMHGELMRAIAGDPEVYAPIYGATDSDSRRKLQRGFFLAYRGHYWLAQFEMQEVSEHQVRHEYVDNLLASEIGRQWWRRARGTWLANEAHPVMRTFARIVDDEISLRGSPDPTWKEEVDTMTGNVDSVTWRKSTKCNVGSCVEVALTEDSALVRSTEKPDLVIRFHVDEWRAFIAGVHAGEFDY